MTKPFLRAALLLTLAGAAPVAMSSCSNAEKQEAANDVADASADAQAATRSAYDDFTATVERAETDAKNVDLSDTDFSREMDQAKADYDAKVAAVDRDLDQYSAEQKAEIEKLKVRYTTAIEQRQAAYKAHAANGGMATTTVTGGKLYKPVASTYATLPPTSLRATYEAFTRMVKDNEDKYDTDDWRAVNADWQALNARKDQVEAQLSADDKREIAKEQVKYAAFKTFDKAEGHAAEGAVKVGEAAGKAGRAIDRTAEKVGDAAKGAYKGARDAIKKDDK